MIPLLSKQIYLLKLADAMKKDIPNLRINPRIKYKDYVRGLSDHKNGRVIALPDNENYMTGYNSYEPVIAKKRIDGQKIQYSLCDINTDYRAAPEWHNTISEAIYWGNVCHKKDKLKAWITYPVIKSFYDLVTDDSLIKADIKRLYQANFYGGISTSIDNGKTWFDGGIMSYPQLPSVERQKYYIGRNSSIRHNSWRKWDNESGFYLNRAYPEELKKGSFELKPPMPIKPEFDGSYWKETQESWWDFHLLESQECKSMFDIKQTVEGKTANGNRHFYIDENCQWRCECFKTKLADYEKRLADYKNAIEEWHNL